MGTGNEGVRVGVAITSATPKAITPPTPLRPQAAPKAVATKQTSKRKVMLAIEVWELDPPAENRNIETNHAQRVAQLGVQDFRSNVGLKTEGQIIGDGGQALGRWRYEPVAAA